MIFSILIMLKERVIRKYLLTLKAGMQNAGFLIIYHEETKGVGRTV